MNFYCLSTISPPLHKQTHSQSPLIFLFLDLNRVLIRSLWDIALINIYLAFFRSQSVLKYLHSIGLLQKRLVLSQFFIAVEFFLYS